MIDFDKVLQNELKDPEFKKQFEKDEKLVKLAYKIAAAREEQGLSQGELAKLAGVTQQQVSRLETAYSSNIQTYIKVLNALGMELDITPSDKKRAA